MKEFIEQLKKIDYFIYVPLLVLVVGFSVLAWLYYQNNTYDESEVNAKLKSAESSYQQLDYSGAYIQYYNVLEITPKNMRPYEGLIQIHLDKSQIEQAIDIYNQADENLNASDLALLAEKIANKAYDLGDYSIAAQYYLESIELDATDSSYDAYSRSVLKQGELPEQEYLISNELKDVVDIYKNAVNTDDIELRLERAVRLFELGYYRLSDEVFSGFVDEIDEYADGLVYYGVGKYMIGDYDLAIELLKDAVILDSTHAEAHLYLAKSMKLADSPSTDTFEMYMRALALQPQENRVEIADQAMDYLIEKKQFSYFDELVSFVPDRKWVNFGEIRILYARGEYAEVVNLYELDGLIELDKSKQALIYAKSYAELEQVENLSTFIGFADSERLLNQAWIYYFEAVVVDLQDEPNVERKYYKAIDADLDGEVSELSKRKLGRL